MIQPIEEDAFVANNQPAEDNEEYETLKYENGIDTCFTPESLDAMPENPAKTAFPDPPELESVATPKSSNEPFSTGHVSEVPVDPFGSSGGSVAKVFAETDAFATEEAQKAASSGFGDDGFGDAFGAEETSPSNCCTNPMEAAATGFDDQFSF